MTHTSSVWETPSLGITGPKTFSLSFNRIQAMGSTFNQVVSIFSCSGKFCSLGISFLGQRQFAWAQWVLGQAAREDDLTHCRWTTARKQQSACYPSCKHHPSCLLTEMSNRLRSWVRMLWDGMIDRKLKRHIPKKGICRLTWVKSLQVDLVSGTGWS